MLCAIFHYVYPFSFYSSEEFIRNTLVFEFEGRVTLQHKICLRVVNCLIKTIQAKEPFHFHKRSAIDYNYKTTAARGGQRSL